jgi:hypothetical protein
MSRFTEQEIDEAHDEADEDNGYCEYEPRARWVLGVLRNRLPDGAQPKVEYTRTFCYAGGGVEAGVDWTYGVHVGGRYICRVVVFPSTAEVRSMALASLVEEAKSIHAFEQWQKERAA